MRSFAATTSQPFVALSLLWACCITTRGDGVRLDFGTTNSPVWPGFTRVTETNQMLSSPEKLVSFWRRTPDDLAGDGVVASRGGFRLELPVPQGAWRVWVLSGDSANGAYNAIKHLLQKVRIRAEGRRVFEQQRDYWYAEPFDYDPAADVWERYAGTNRFLEATFSVEVKDGVLTLDFEGLTGQRPEYAFPLNALMACLESESATMDQDLAAVRIERRRQWSQRFPQLPLPEADRPWTPDAPSATRGYAVWWRDYLEKVYPNSVPRPDESLGPARTFATPGEWEPLSVGIRAVTNLGPVRLEVGDLQGPGGTISRQHIQPYLVRYNENVSRTGAWYAAEPFALVPWSNPRIPANVTRQCWLKVKVPTNAVPGRYLGTVTVQPERAASQHLDYEFEVLPFVLERSTNASFFYYGSRARLEYDTSGRGWFDNRDWWRFYDLESSNLVAHGFVPLPEIRLGNAGGYGVDAIPQIDGRTNLVAMDWSRADRRVAWLAKRGYLPPDRLWVVKSDFYAIGYCGGQSEQGRLRWSTDANHSNLFCQITRAVDRKVREAGWGVPVFEWRGELSNTGHYGPGILEYGRHAYSALKSCGVLTALRGNGWVDWSLYATNRLVDFPIPNIALMRDAYTGWIANNCQALWLYNFAGARYGFGFFAWAKGATRRLHEGHMDSGGAPWDKFDGSHYHWHRGAEPTRDGVAPLVFSQWMSEGRDDYDYVRTLERRLSRARQGPAQQQGRQVLDSVRSLCVTDVVYRGDPKEPANVEDLVPRADLQTWRRRMADAIVQLAE